ncbi:hypothetical protein FB561_2766 [Kribbella amoyensis]|uniref:Uncharacterized protein n=1 Tax=Kribbella amoyensis TaxID=996641 RepID=A0A561BS09_9ACTN|nr:hypothetical protein [Kribbella amoyensis]TWD81646.1 hypothetical protein FB561_2766 [Kribbella amoyensis]
MTDDVRSGTEWVPRFGMLDLPADRAALIRGLFELAAFVVDHPEFALPAVRAVIWPAGWQDDFSAACGEVDRVAGALHVEAQLRKGQYVAEAAFGPVDVTSFVISAEARAEHDALSSYRGSVRPEASTQERPGHHAEAEPAARYGGGSR